MRERVCEGMFNKLRTARLPLWIWQALPPLIRCSRSKNESVLSTLHLLATTDWMSFLTKPCTLSH